MRRLLLTVALGLGPVALLLAQQPAPTPQGQPPPFRAGVDVFELEITVLDRNREPVRGLTSADFTITEAGRLQPIVAFSEVEFPDYDGPLTTAVEDVAPDVAARRYADRRLIAIVMDDFGMPERPSEHLQMLAEAKAIGKFLVDRLGRLDFASVILSRDTRYFPDFSNDRWKLYGYVNELKPPEGAERAWLYWVTKGHIGGLSALQDVTRYLAKLPQHKKLIIYVSIGQSVGPASAAHDRMLNVIKTASEAGIPIYAIDPSGLTVGGWGRLDLLRTLAENTGGSVAVMTNEVRPVVLDMLEQTRSYYLIGYQQAGVNDGKFRRIEVKLKRPGLTAVTRSGRTAPGVPDMVKPPPLPIDEEVDAAIEDLGKASGRRLAAYAAVRAGALDIVAEIGVTEFSNPRWSAGADVEARVTRGPGDLVTTARGNIAPGQRSVRLVVPLQGVPPPDPDAAPVPLHVSLKATAGATTLEDGADAVTDGRLLGQPNVFRARTANTAPIYPVAEFQFARTERVRLDFPLLKAASERHARLLRRTGETMSGLPNIVERQVDGRTVLSLDLSLSFLAPADYVFELFVKEGAESDRKLVAFKVK